MSIFENIIWFTCGGFFSALNWLLAGILWSITIIGLPVGKQCFKFAALAACPFGKEIIYGGGAGSLMQHFKMAKLALMPFGSQIIYT